VCHCQTILRGQDDGGTEPPARTPKKGKGSGRTGKGGGKGASTSPAAKLLQKQVKEINATATAIMEAEQFFAMTNNTTGFKCLKTADIEACLKKLRARNAETIIKAMTTSAAIDVDSDDEVGADNQTWTVKGVDTTSTLWPPWFA
jgi:hypothetical protein